ncbi:MAG: hypothetical protein K1X79_06315 [Oligoflexia bacterium]|nr:hypothetical protein [Oligoflexia bacterium]
MSKSFARILLLIFTLALFVFVNRGPQQAKSALQISYDAWLATLRDSIESQDSNLQKPALRIEFSSSYPELQANWSLASTGNNDNERKILRLMELVSEASLFSLEQLSSTKQTPALTLGIEGGSRRFDTRFSRAAIDRNVTAQSFLKLFEFYASQKPTIPLTQQ